MKALEFTCDFRDVVALAVHTGYTSRECNLSANLRTDGSYIIMKVVVSFNGGSVEDSEKALQFLKALTDKERIGSCYITI